MHIYKKNSECWRIKYDATRGFSLGGSQANNHESISQDFCSVGPAPSCCQALAACSWPATPHPRSCKKTTILIPPRRQRTPVHPGRLSLFVCASSTSKRHQSGAMKYELVQNKYASHMESDHCCRLLLPRLVELTITCSHIARPTPEKRLNLQFVFS